MPSIDQVAEAVRGLSSTSPARGAVLTRMVRHHSARDVLVLGFQRGAIGCYIAAALEQRGEGHVVIIGGAHRIAESPSIDELLDTLSVHQRATVFYEYDGYNWRLGQLLTQRPRPQFDLVVLNGRHYWDTDGFAFLLAEQLLAPGGYLVFGALHWTIGGSDALSDQTRHLPDEVRDTQHVKLVCDELVKPHPNIAECWDDGQWGFARKRDGDGRLADDARDAATELIRERARTVRSRAEDAWRSGRTDRLATVSPMTGTRPKLAREFDAET